MSNKIFQDSVFPTKVEPKAMKKTTRLFLLYWAVISITMLFLTAGCATDTQLVTQTKYIVVKPNPTELQDCIKRPPPDRDVYLKLSDPEKEAALATYARQLQGDIGKCDNHAALRKFYEEQEKIYSPAK